MPGRNTKALTDDEIKSLKEFYTFEVKDEFVIVRCKTKNVSTAHDINHPFFVKNKDRKITFRPDIIKLWIDKFYSKGFDLLDIQNAANVLYILKQPIDFDSIENYLNRGSSKITKINDAQINYKY